MNTWFVIFTALLSDNLLLSKLFGIETFFAGSEKSSAAVAYGGSVTLVTLITGSISLTLYKFILEPLNVGFMATFLTVLIISAVVCGVNYLSKGMKGKFQPFFAANMPLISTNCVVVGAVMLCIENSYGLWTSMLYLLFAGAGFTLAMIVFSSVRERIALSDTPASFRGLPVLLLSASLAAMAFAGFAGIGM